ncbi:MAG: hypothetical protein L0Y72_19250 [Gemmataceae bacterium]|nr:hypothetical protein [Gemmataceae bacterium]
MATPIETAIESNAIDGIAEVQGEAGRVRQYSLKDQIEADKYTRAAKAVPNANRGIRFTRLVPPGAVGGE